MDEMAGTVVVGSRDRKLVCLASLRSVSLIRSICLRYLTFNLFNCWRLMLWLAYCLLVRQEWLLSPPMRAVIFSRIRNCWLSEVSGVILAVWLFSVLGFIFGGS